MHIARAVNNKILVGLIAIGAQQANATEAISEAINQILDYVATYVNNDIAYRASDMVLCGNSDAVYLNKTKSRSRAVAYIFLSEDDAVLRLNGPVLTVTQIIKFVMSSAAEAEIADLFITAKLMAPMQQTIIKMGWPHPKSLIKT